MTSNKIPSTLFAAVFLSAAFAAAASAQAAKPPMHHHSHSAMHHAAKGHMAGHKDSGDAAVDALNQQSLDAARSGSAPTLGAPAAAPASMPQ